ncbi:MAG TPA: hypothetical protein VK471_11775 [Solirubrobacterales bacterium]|nr:hypothetical protein [Solirubrobacterales bacterium]
MTSPTFTISASERDTLHGLMLRRLLVLGENPSGLAKAEGITGDELCEQFGDDLRLMEDIDWVFETDQESVELTMPPERLTEALKRLRRDARRAPYSLRHEREPKESVDERWRRFRQAVEVCEELLDRLDSSSREEETAAAAPISTISPEQVKTHELTPYTPVTDGFILAAVERAELHEQEGEVLTSELTAHLGFEGKPATNRLLFPRLEELRRAGLLTSTERRGEPFWSLTSVGRERLAKEREAGEIGELPESPQHRAWRHARIQAAVRIEQLRGEQTAAVEAAYDLMYQPQPSGSAEWFEVAERLRWTTWRVASAIHCLSEWMEPDDETPDVDEDPGPSPGRRAISAWDKAPLES